ncbi:MAG TPA: tRNA dihydrouridine(20/20a) synthase DusA [Burkholderiales bacterium]|nr:tRNA dihydrouridine(20/20a) synthase DusA [Burkholderiales bacterium]
MTTIDHRLCTAPMMDWSDRHCRYFFRQLAPHAVVYTEMVTTGALIHGDVDRHLRFDAAEHPVALQLGGSDPGELAYCARLGHQYGYDEINLNCGCPSERVQRGAFGASLMAEPMLVAQCVAAMRDATPIPVTVKHRLGIDSIETYGFVRDFVGTLAEAGCQTFLVHARNAVLRGLSPKANREVPPLKYEFVHRLKRDFPELQIVLNGGIGEVEFAAAELEHLDGVMLGRTAYHDPHVLAQLDARLFGGVPRSREAVVDRMHDYAGREMAGGTPLRAIARHMLGLYHGRPNARSWRRMLSDPLLLSANRPDLLREALPRPEAVPA